MSQVNKMRRSAELTALSTGKFTADARCEAIGVGVFSWFRRAPVKRSGSNSMPLAGPRPPSFKSVELVPGDSPCPAVKKLAGHRFLCAEAPRFPLRECNRGACTCSYRHHADRRKDPRRAADSCTNVLDMGNGQPHDRRASGTRGRRRDEPRSGRTS